MKNPLGSTFQLTVLFTALVSISAYAVELNLGDDDFEEVALPFSFPFCGNSYDSVFVGSNGYLTFGAGDTDFTESVGEMLDDPPRISALWDDLNPSVGGTVDASAVGSDFVVTFADVPEFFNSGSNSFAVTLRPDGSFNIAYGQITAPDGLVGRTMGLGSFDVGETDVTVAPQPLSAPQDDLIYELFSASDNDLAFADLEWASCGLVMVDIDIKFCSNPNAYNCKSMGVLPVTIFGTSGYDVADIDLDSLQLCRSDTGDCTPGGVASWSEEDRGDPTSDLGAAMCAIDPDTGEELRTLNPDGFTDLDAAFAAAEVQALLDDFCSGEKDDLSPTLYIMGTLTNGTELISLPSGEPGAEQLTKKN